MRKIIFIVLIVIVAALVGFFCWREFSIPNINYVGDYRSDSDHRIKIQRLYAAEVDFDAYNEELEAILNITDYTEQDRLAAAIASGQPQFFPSFSLNMQREGDEIRIKGTIDSELAEKQKEERFKIDQISLEAIITAGALEFDRVKTTPAIGGDDSSSVKIHADRQMAVDISDSPVFEIILTNESDEGAFGANLSGTVTLQFIYSIRSDTFMPKTVLEEQLLQLHAIIESNEYGVFDVKFEIEPYSNMEELNG